MTRTRRIVLGLVLVFVIYAVVVSPNQSADLVRSIVDLITRAVQALFDFFDALLRR